MTDANDRELVIRDLRVAPAASPDLEILQGIDLTIRKGETHAIMGPNGSGKTTLAYALMGHPAYVVKSGEVSWKGYNLLKLSPDKRSRLGLFLAFQYPTAIPGLSVASFIRSALNAKLQGIDKNPDIDPTDTTRGGVSMLDFRRRMREKMALLKMEDGFATRYVNDGFSGGEKKRLEMLQMAMLEPEFAVLDETDSGLDIDALRIVAEGVNAMLNPNMGVLLITHYQRLLNYITPDYVHVLAAGRIVKLGRQGPRAAPRGGGLRPDPARGRPRDRRPRRGAGGPARARRRPRRAGRHRPMTTTAARATTSETLAPSVPTDPLDPETLRADFPILDQEIHGHRLAYLDSASTALKPRSVIDALVAFNREPGERPSRRLPALRGRDRRLRALPRGKAPGSSAPPHPRESSSCAAPPSRSTSSRTPGPRTSAPATSSSRPRWSTTRTSSRGSRSPGAGRRPGSSRSSRRNLVLPSRAPESEPKLVAVTAVSNALGRSTRSPRSPSGRTRTARSSSSTARRRAAPAGRRQGDRRDFLAFSGHKLFAPTGSGARGGASGWRRCRPSWAAAR